jgi:hypothetical protein
MGTSLSAAAVAAASAAVSVTVQLPAGTAMGGSGAPAVAWSSQGVMLVIGLPSRRLFSAAVGEAEQAVSALAVAKPIATLPASFGGICGLAVLSGAATGEALLVSTPDKLLILTARAGEGGWARAVACCAQDPSLWASTIALSEPPLLAPSGQPHLPDTHTSTHAHAHAPLRIMASASGGTAHVTWCGRSSSYTFDLDGALPGAFDSWRALYAPHSLCRLRTLSSMPLADVCTLPWYVLAVAPPVATGAPARLLTFSRASGHLLGSVDVPTAAAPAGRTPCLAADTDDPCGELGEAVSVSVIGAAARARVRIPPDLLPVALDLVAAGRMEAAQKVLEGLPRQLSTFVLARGWSALGRALYTQGNWVGAAEAFGRVEATDICGLSGSGEYEEHEDVVPFTQAALLFAGAARMCDDGQALKVQPPCLLTFW